MDYVNLGKTGLKVSRICLGCMTYGSPAKEGQAKGGRHYWALTEDESRPFFRQALDLGINFFDTANVYSSGDSEVVLGNFLKGNTRREAVVIGGFRPTTWISTRPTAGIARRPSRRRWRRSTMR
jgi:aryl-alcohol dehydrogenase-like predicted oxidoreductase